MAANSVIAALRVTLGLDSAQFERGADRTRGTARGLGGAFGELKRGVTGLGQALGAALTGGAALQALTTLRDMTRAAVDSAGAIGEQAQQLGVTTDALQEYRYAATQVGLSTEQMDNALAQLTRRTGDAATGTGPAAAAFERLGINLRDAEGNLRTTSSLIPLIAEALKGLPSDAERAAVSVDLFGRAGQQLAPLLSNGAAGVNELTSAARELGVVLSSEQIAQADEVADRMAALNYQIEAQQNAKLLENAEALMRYESSIADLKLQLIDGSNVLQSWVDAIDAQAARNKATVDRWKAEIAAAFTGMVSSIVQMKDNALRAVQDLVNGIRDWLGGRITAIFSGVRQEIVNLERGFAWLWDQVVGHSWIPDMVDAIGANMARLQSLMVDPAERATRSTSEAFRTLAGDVSGILDGLFPELAQMRSTMEDMATLERALTAGLLDRPTFNEAHRRLSAQATDLITGAGEDIQVVDPEQVAADFRRGLGAVDREMQAWARSGEMAAVKVERSFADMADSVLASLQTVINGFRGGGFFDIVNGILGAAQQFLPMVLGQPGKGGTVPGFASGGGGILGGFGGIDRNVLSLNGSPIARVSAGEHLRVTPANDRGGAGALRVTVTMDASTGALGAFVQDQAGRVVAQAAPAMIDAAANAGVARMMRRNDRSFG